MQHSSRVLPLTVLSLIVIICLPLLAAKNSEHRIASYGKYVQIPGATPMGADTCTTCHADIAKDYRHAFHAQQGVECEQCHGPGSLHVQGGGDVSKIISFKKRSATDANGVCLSCHARDERVRNWTAGTHASHKVRCIDCHQTHTYSAKGKTDASLGVVTNVSTQGSVGNVEDLIPEAKVMMQPRWQANDACLRCHQTERGQMSLPYHHPLREGKMSCADCHDPHGGPGGNNLRTANTNQLCLSCHAQYRGPFAYQHPPVTENCMICHTAHGSPNTNLLSVSEPALCLQCHAGHHNGAGLPISDRCTNCHGSIHGTDTPTPSGGSRFIDKGLSEPQLRAGLSAKSAIAAHAPMTSTSAVGLLPSHSPSFGVGAAGTTLGMLSRLVPMSGGMSAAMSGDNTNPTEGATQTDAAYSFVPGSYRFVDITGFGGRVGEYDTLQQSAGADVATSYVSSLNHVTVVTRGSVLNSQDYQAASQLTAADWARVGLDIRSFVQQQDHYPFAAFPLLDVSSGCSGPCDTTTDLIPSHVPFYVVRRLGKAQGQVKLPKLPVHLFVNGDWQARSGTTQFAYLDENSYVPSLGANGQFCGAQCHYQSQFQRTNYTTRTIGGGGDVDLGPVRLTYQHKFSSFKDRLIFPTGTFTGGFDADASSCEAFAFGFAGAQCAPSSFNPPPSGPAPGATAALPTGTGYPIDIPSPNQYSSDSVSFNWTASPKLIFNGNVNYTRSRDTYTNYPQNSFDSDETLIWRPLDRLRVAANYHQQNLINNFTPYYSLYGNVSYHDHGEGLKLEYELPRNFDVEGYYKRSGITRSNAALWNDTAYNIYGSQIYSVDNTDLLKVVPTSFSNTTGLALRYHDAGLWSARAGYEWTGTHNPGYLIMPRSDNRVFASAMLTPRSWLTFDDDINIIVQNAFPAVPLPYTPGVTPLSAPGATGSFGLNIAGLPSTYQRSNRFYVDTFSAALRPTPSWSLGLGYSYQQNNMKTYMAFQNDNATGYILDEPLVPYKQIMQAYWGESTYAFRQRAGLNFRLTYNSARSGFRPDVNSNDAAGLGNAYLVQQGAFDPNGLFPSALGNLNTISTQISEVIVPQWIGQSKAYYIFPRKFEGGLLFYYGSYRDYWNPNLNGDLRTFSVYVGRSW